MPGGRHISESYAVWLACVALQRLVELWISRRHIALLPSSERERVAEGRAGWNAMVALHVALIALPALEVESFERHPPTWLVIAAFGSFCAAQAVRVWSIATLGAAWNARGIVARTTPTVSRGPYAFVRHPNYAAVQIEFLAIPLGGGAWLSWIALNALHLPILWTRIRGEERWLMQDENWRRDMADKPRFFPRVTRT